MPTERYRPDYPDNDYRVDPLYIRMTTPRGTNDGRGTIPSVQELFREVSTTSHFKVTLFLGDAARTGNPDSDLNSWLISCGVLGNRGNLNSLRYEFMCHSTNLPGSTMRLADEFGSRQGITEKFPIVRDFSELTMDFYVDAQDYGIIRLFEEWINFINPLYTKSGRAREGSSRGSNSSKIHFDAENFYRMRYPDTYRKDVAITKFERDFQVQNGEVISRPAQLTYKFINAYPINLTATPVSYEVSTITKTSVTFNYERYVILNHRGVDNPNQYTPPNISRTQNGDTIPLSTPTLFSGSLNQDPSQNLPIS